mmetsp:Transcript_7822/g.14216  ORF Transcript_7822/g.14216 Transcript_7822/m.14216 type:complete len:87 (-) Transcript_7822:280-540(-)
MANILLTHDERVNKKDIQVCRTTCSSNHIGCYCCANWDRCVIADDESNEKYCRECVYKDKRFCKECNDYLLLPSMFRIKYGMYISE